MLPVLLDCPFLIVYKQLEACLGFMMIAIKTFVHGCYDAGLKKVVFSKLYFLIPINTCFFCISTCISIIRILD